MTTLSKLQILFQPFGEGGKLITDRSSHVQKKQFNISLDQDRVSIKQILSRWKIQRKKLNNFSQEQRLILNGIIQAVQAYFKVKIFNLQKMLDCIQISNSLINIYEKNPWPIKFSDHFIKHTEKCIKQLDELYSEKIRETDCSKQLKKQYQDKFNPILYFLIIFIAKTQKERNQLYYKNTLDKILKKDTRKIIINLPLFQQQSNLKFFGAILGNIGENYLQDKCFPTLIKKIFQTFQKLSHQKTLYYIVNFIREKARNINFRQNQVDGTIIINKFKRMIKERFYSNQYQIATILDLYTNMYDQNKQSYPQLFYDQQIFLYTLDYQSGLNISFPTAAYKTIFYNGSKKYINFMMNKQINKQRLNVEVVFNESLVKFCQFITVNDTNFQQNVSLIQKIFPHIGQLYLFELTEYGFLDLVIKLLNYGDNITLSGLKIIRMIINKIKDYSYALKQTIYNKLIQEIQLLTEQTNHFSISSDAKNVIQSFKDSIEQSDQRWMVLE